MMRLHRLELTAFGPFPGTQSVDFDSLNAAGIFLLSGPTGGGKTSVLDAVSFALFGRVPGERDKAKQLRSDHASPGVGPRVVLETTLRTRRVRITRSPEWLRPKKRGSGSTREPAKVLLEECVDDRWQQRTNRIDEAADLLGDLIGMTAGQFCQVALLPQGRFETFLRAGSQERHSLLERLFDAHRFRVIEEWLAERRTLLGRTSVEHETEVGTVLARVAEVSGQQPPSDDAGHPMLDDRLADWSAHVRDTIVDALVGARAERAEADLTVKRARADRDDALTLVDLQRRHADAVVRQERLDALVDDTHELTERVAAAHRAQAVQPLVDLHDEALQGARSARAAARSSFDTGAHHLPTALRRQVGELLDQECPTSWCGDALTEAAHAARAQTAQLTALLPTQAELHDVAGRIDSTAGDIREQVTLQEQAALTTDALARQRADLQQRMAALDGVTEELQVLRQRLHGDEARLTAACLVEQVEDRRRTIGSQAAQATEQALTARAAWLDTRQRRLDGMAAELAGGLVAGTPCPVCGGREHPAPAEPTQLRVTAADERRAEQRCQQLDRERERLHGQLRECETELAAAVADAGGLDAAAASRARDHTADELDRATQARQQTLALTGGLRRVDDEAVSAGQVAAGIETGLATLRERFEQLRARRDHLRDRLAQALGSAADLGACLGAARTAEQAATRVGASVTAWQTACSDHASHRRRLDQALRARGFVDLTDARSKMLSAAEVGDLEALLTHRMVEQRRVREILDDPAARAAAVAPTVDLDGLEHRLTAVEEQRDAAVTALSELARQADRLERLHSRLDAALSAWRPVRTAHRTATALAALCAGTSADNPDRVRLSSYVLAARLSQVVDSANERLGRMTAGRYLLEHSDARGVGDHRGGLGLRVRDGWTGESRDPATLSGGETFIASLALALGLADVVAYEAGGAEVATLFVDEGFGLLDDDSLDEVMDVLDDLRSGGRVVGLVSHVAELRARVGTQLRVVKDRHGSTLEQM